MGWTSTTFELPKDARPEDILVVKGEVRDEQGKVVRDAKVEIKYMDTRKTEVLTCGQHGWAATPPSCG